MATIKPIEGRSVHQIQSGQVIVDLCSVAKELVENGIDAGATSVEIRFKNSGLDSIEVQDNGCGISPDDFDTVALKHYTSKLSTYDDLSSLQTFGFRGEALSSLCALSKFHIVTARAGDAAKGTKLEFEVSGKLKSTSVVASPQGTLVAVENLFYNLPVRRRELEKNIKREYNKVLNLLHAYACISIGVRFSVSNQLPKGKKTVTFSTKANPTTKENIINVYGAKTFVALVALNLQLEMQPSRPTSTAVPRSSTDDASKIVRLVGYISRPVVGEGRQTPDRQMFFVNSRPCALPQISKAINEVYKSYNVTQSPFIFANFEMDTNAYDVNVSPDKRTIFLHDQTALLEALKSKLNEMFENHDQTVPLGLTSTQKTLASAKTMTNRSITSLLQPSVTPSPARYAAKHDEDAEGPESSGITAPSSDTTAEPNLDHDFSKLIVVNAQKNTRARIDRPQEQDTSARTLRMSRGLEDNPIDGELSSNERDSVSSPDSSTEAAQNHTEISRDVSHSRGPILKSFGTHGWTSAEQDEEPIPSTQSTPQKSTLGPIQNAFDRMRPKKTPGTVVTMTIGDTTTTQTLGVPERKRRRIHVYKSRNSGEHENPEKPTFGSSLRAFATQGVQDAASDDESISGSDDGGEDEDEEDGTVASDDSTTEDQQNHSEQDSQANTPDAGVEQQSPPRSTKQHSPDQEASPLFVSENEEDASDPTYMEEGEKKKQEEARVQRMIAEAEQKAARPTEENLKRAEKALKVRSRKDSTLQVVGIMRTSVAVVEKSAHGLQARLAKHQSVGTMTDVDMEDGDIDACSAEERLTLTVSKSDFSRMRIAGQFNLGFILALRRAQSGNASTTAMATAARHQSTDDELFIIDQHASDEKYNFERLQRETIVQNQRLVHARQLELTAVEEEIIGQHPSALTKNGFSISFDESGESPVGRRCRLLSLPMSREVVFDTRDLEELIALLAEHAGGPVPRPGKVRRMFAMRACRSSVMIGTSLSERQMRRIVDHMGELDKPWNCPHGRPTMRHVCRLGQVDSWREGDGLAGLGEEREETDWTAFLARANEAEDEDGSVNGEDEEELE